MIRARSDFERQAVISATALEACSFCAKLPCCMQCMFRMFLAKNFAVDQICCSSLSFKKKHEEPKNTEMEHPFQLLYNTYHRDVAETPFEVITHTVTALALAGWSHSTGVSM